MKRAGWKSVAVIVVVVAIAWWVVRRRGPEDRVAARYQQLCDLAADNVATPARGVDRLTAFVAGEGADQLHDLAELVVDTTAISDERRHDEHAREARRRMRAPLLACAETLTRFAEAVDSDEEAHAKLARTLDRLVRTLQLLFGDTTSSPRDLRELFSKLPLAAP
ncbi:MAG: hypothetical protein JWM53_1641 [bacterium]|nr:hypothetical protein [bacterium]